MAESICFSLTKNDNGFEVRIASKKTVNIFCFTHFIIPTFTLYHSRWNHYELEQLTNNSSVGHKVEDLVEPNAYDTEQVSNTSCSQLEY